MQLARTNRVSPVLDPFVDSFFDGVLDTFHSNGSTARTLPINVREEADHYVVEAEVPGATRDQVEVSIEGRNVTIRRKAAESSEKNKDGYLCREIKSFAAERVISLPEWADSRSADAQMRDGIITITVPKTESAKPKLLEIK